jgi:hypothetical protein
MLPTSATGTLTPCSTDESSGNHSRSILEHGLLQESVPLLVIRARSAIVVLSSTS